MSHPFRKDLYFLRSARLQCGHADCDVDLAGQARWLSVPPPT
jgi:hypothetical protein